MGNKRARGSVSDRGPIRIIKHEAVPNCGSYEVKYSDGQPSRYFYFEDVPGRRLRSEQMNMEGVKSIDPGPSGAYRDARATHAPRCSRIGPSVTFAMIAAPSRSTETVNATQSRRRMLSSLFRGCL
jgi:hypothetical protein